MDILFSDEFQGLLFITCFFPFITPRTPIINYNELCRAQERANRHQLARVDLSRGGEDNYTVLMNEALTTVKEKNV